MVSRLPTVGGDTGNWGTVLNDFLSQSHNANGTLIGTSVSAAGAEMTANKGVAGGYASLDGGGKVPSSQLSIANDTSTQKVRVSKAGALQGTRQEINLIQGSNVTLTTADDSGNNRVNVTIAASGGAVTSVNTQTGVVSLAAGDVGADPVGSADAVAASAPAFLRYNTGSSSYATRASVTGDTNRMVIWVGPVAPTIGGSGAINDIDVWWKTP